MKRGLVVLDPAEVPDAEWRHRVAVLQRRMPAEGIDVALIYGDVSRSDDIAYLTNLCIYWNEGVLAVPAEGDPVFLTKLSPRVHPWMRRTSTISEVRSGKSFGALIAGYLESRRDGMPAVSAGIVDAGLWPSAAVEEIAREISAVPGGRLTGLGGLVRDQRLIPSGHEQALLRRGAGILADAADQATRPGMAAMTRVATVEGALRGAGFLDVAARAAETADGVVSLQVTGQYRNLWLHVSRLVTDDGEAGWPGWPGAMRHALAAAVRAAADGVSAAHMTAVAGPALAGLPATAVSGVRWVNQADMATAGEYADYPAGLPMQAGSVVVITVETEFADGQTAAVADTVLIETGTAESLTGKAIG
jgi:hypothetical protein